MQNRFFFAGVFAVALAAQPLVCPSLQAQDGNHAAEAHRPLPKPTNLKVLPKYIAPEDLRKIMRGFAGALGVECKFCHEVNPQTHKPDFASDAKDDKKMARIMVQMTHNINQEYMAQIHDPDAKPEDQHVTCGTCHRGHKMPEHFVPPPEHQHHEGSMPMGQKSE